MGAPRGALACARMRRCGLSSEWDARLAIRTGDHGRLLFHEERGSLRINGEEVSRKSRWPALHHDDARPRRDCVRGDCTRTSTCRNTACQPSGNSSSSRNRRPSAWRRTANSAAASIAPAQSDILSIGRTTTSLLRLAASCRHRPATTQRVVAAPALMSATARVNWSRIWVATRGRRPAWSWICVYYT